MHPLERFLGRREVIDTVGLLEIFLGVLCQSPWLPITSIFYEQYPISSKLVLFANENCLTLACDEDVIFFVDRDPLFCEN